jgi:hypothetical protein
MKGELKRAAEEVKTCGKLITKCYANAKIILIKSTLRMTRSFVNTYQGNCQYLSFHLGRLMSECLNNDPVLTGF